MRVEILRKIHKSKHFVYRFICAAMATENTRYAINKLCVQKDCIVATDGRRLHVAHFDHNLEEGFYEVVKNNKSTLLMFQVEPDGNFPKWQEVVPKSNSYFNAYTNRYFIEYVLGGLAKKDVGINRNFLSPFLYEEYIEWKVSFSAKDRPVKFESKIDKIKIMAVLMPLQVGYDEIIYHTNYKIKELA